MTSRLDRLFVLLESGGSSVTRQAAAKQIGEVQRLCPNELHTLLNRLISFLHSSSWDTRVAAAHAVLAILENVPQWHPETVISTETIKTEEAGTTKNVKQQQNGAKSKVANSNSKITANDANSAGGCIDLSASSERHQQRLLSIQEFNLSQILQNGARLIGSEGVEFEVSEETGQQGKSNGNSGVVDSTEFLSKQRALINERLGFNDAAKFGINLTDLITDDDVRRNGNGSANSRTNAHRVPIEDLLYAESAPVCLDLSNKSTMSCRETNRAKRRARQLASFAANATTSTAVETTSPSGSYAADVPCCSSAYLRSGCDEPERKKSRTNDIPKKDIYYSIADPVPDLTGSWTDANFWPFQNFCARLFVDLFNTKWEVRHGAAMALRELINTHVEGAGKMTSMTITEMKECHNRWLEDATMRLLCVLCLDRFGDFGSVQVVAPVRETIAQVLGMLVKHIDARKVHDIVLKLVEFVKHTGEWEVRHGGYLGLKYVFVVRDDLLKSYLPPTISDILPGLLDKFEDVGAAAASALIPVATWLPKIIDAKQLSRIVKMLWDLLLVQDELASASNSYMGLLATILSLPNAQDCIQMEPMSELIPRLWAFLSHSTSSVRSSTLQTLKTITTFRSKMEYDATTTSTNISGSGNQLQLNFDVKNWSWKLLQDALRHIYQRILVEPQADIQSLACEVWVNMIKNADLGALLHAACPFVSSWICLAMQPTKLAFDATLLIFPTPIVPIDSPVATTRRRIQRNADDWQIHSLSNQKLFLGGSEATPAEVREENYMRARIAASGVLGALSQYLIQPAPGVIYTAEMESPTDCYSKVLLVHLDSRSAVQRSVCGLIIAYWGLFNPSVRPGPPNLQRKLHECVNENSICYDEMAYASTRLLQEAQDFAMSLKLHKVFLPDIKDPKLLTLNDVESVAFKFTENLATKLTYKPKIGEKLETRRQNLQSFWRKTTAEIQASHVTAQAALASAIVAMHCLPDKLNPIIRPLMESIKREECLLLQELSTEFLVELMDQIYDRQPNPNSKIFNNLCTLLRTDAEFTPKIPSIDKDLSKTAPPASAYTKCAYYGILSLQNQQTDSARSNGNASASVARGPGRPPHHEANVFAQTVTPTDASESSSGELEAKQYRIQRLGATCAITKICQRLGEKLFEKIPIFESLMIGKLYQFVAEHKLAGDKFSAEMPKIFCEYQSNELITSLQLIEVAAPHLDKSLHERLFALLPLLGVVVVHPFNVVRHMAARCIAKLADIDAGRTMNFVVSDLLPLTRRIDNIIDRQGALETIDRVVDQLQLKLVPYITLLIVPLLGSMSDTDESVRLLATHCFATLIQLMPLDSKTNKLIELPELQARKERDSDFLNYLFAPSTIPNYKVPVPLSVTLRSYQQSGVNWLWFLNKYNLHGILCDDMGLGKTLQAICILAGDHYQRAMDKEQPYPSLVICPPTLTGHWMCEIDKFLLCPKILRPLHYVGLPPARERLRACVGTTSNVVVASYDTIRKDIDYFSDMHWNYCILDEGHIIKNGKTKGSKAIKQLKANHRLILSGTPIQNNVLELWSLFDFLMPGFLGTERQFMVRYSRPILASRDAKSTSKEQEAGVLAMEALHRQVLPFLLRRVKEEVLNDLPPKITQDLLCDLSPLQERLYEDFNNQHIRGCIDQLSVESNAGKSHVFQALRYLQNVCNHPKLVWQDAMLLRPMLSGFMNTVNLNDIENSTKLLALRQLLLDCGIGVQTESVSQHRALIFCQLKTMLDIVENDLLRTHLPSVTYLRLDGSVRPADRQKLVTQFNSDPSIDVLILTTQVGGLGLNLTGADTVIFVEHDWNPMKDLQAMDRAHRIGQKKVVNVYRLIAKNTLEEKIMGLQKFKLLTANTVISAENSSLQTMGTSEILDLFDRENSASKESVHNKFSLSAGVGQLTMNKVLKNLPELWSESQYVEEYDLRNFVKKF